MLKMGTFGFWRYAMPLFPAAAQHYGLALAVLSVVGIVYGALMCLAPAGREAADRLQRR